MNSISSLSTATAAKDGHHSKKWSRLLCMFKEGTTSLSSTVATKLMQSFQDGNHDDEGAHENEEGSINLDEGYMLELSMSMSMSMSSSTSSRTRRRRMEDDDQSSCSLSLHDLDLHESHCLSSGDSFHHSYSLGQELGKGGFGTVYQCHSKSSLSSSLATTSTSAHKNESYAVKTVLKHKFDQNEIDLLGLVHDCPHIVKVEGVFFELNKFYIVMEECRGGDLLGKIRTKTVYQEDEARIVSRILLQAVQFCHVRGVVHRDLKPENILLKEQDDDTSIQLADFGLAKRFYNADTEEYAPLRTFCGSVEYVAPEVFHCAHNPEGVYDERCDNFSIGLIIYILLGGYHPFDGDTDDEMEQMTCKGEFEFHDTYWKDTSSDAKSLITSLLQVNPDDRCELELALTHPWFQ